MRILVPIDSSTYCQAAIRVAFQIADGLGASLTALHVVNVRPASGNLLNDITGHLGFEPAIVSPETYQAHVESSEALVNGFVARATAEELESSGLVETGAVTQTIVDQSNRHDLVVMGVRGESDDRFPGQGGAQAANALPQIHAPTMLVPRGVTRITALAVGYDGSPAAQRALRLVDTLVVPLGVPVHLIHVGEASTGEALLQEGRALLSGEPEVHQHLVQGDGSVHAVLAQTAMEAGANTLVLGFEGNNKLKDVVFGSAQSNLLTEDIRLALLIAH